MDTNRIKEIQQETAYPNSISVQQALLKVWNECEQQNKELIDLKEVTNVNMVDYINLEEKNKELIGLLKSASCPVSDHNLWGNLYGCPSDCEWNNKRKKVIY